MSLLRLLWVALALVLCVAVSTSAQEFGDMQLQEPLAAAAPHEVSLAQMGAQVEGPTGRRPTPPPSQQPKDKLDVALAAIKQDIMVRNRQLEEEKNWVAEVRKITEQYNKKVHRVEADIVKTRNEVKALFKKKKQVENLKIQRALESKLKDATSDLSTLQQALHHVKSTSEEFEKTKQDIKKTIYGIHTQLSKLKGEKPVVKAPTDL
jgi:predicted RNase H-like nuclease (RuvC/YqgF family)